MAENMTWQQEFEIRLRRVAGCTDDSLQVTVVDGQTGICSTCADYNATIEVVDAAGRLRACRVFDSFPEVLNAVLAVGWKDIHG